MRAQLHANAGNNNNNNNGNNSKTSNGNSNKTNGGNILNNNRRTGDKIPAVSKKASPSGLIYPERYATEWD